MKTNDLIDVLAKQETASPRRAAPLSVALALGLAAGVLILWITIGPRPDMTQAVWLVMLKAAFAAAFAAAGFGLVARLARPGRPAQTIVTVVIALFVLSLVTAAVALIGDDPAARMRAWTGGGVPWCVVLIPLLAAPAAIGMGAIVRTLAPTRLMLTGAAIGAAAGGVGAMAYSVHCPVDSVAFVTTWYAVGIALSAVIGAVLGARLLRW